MKDKGRGQFPFAMRHACFFYAISRGADIAYAMTCGGQPLDESSVLLLPGKSDTNRADMKGPVG